MNAFAKRATLHRRLLSAGQNALVYSLIAAFVSSGAGFAPGSTWGAVAHAEEVPSTREIKRYASDYFLVNQIASFDASAKSEEAAHLAKQKAAQKRQEEFKAKYPGYVGGLEQDIGSYMNGDMPGFKKKHHDFYKANVATFEAFANQYKKKRRQDSPAPAQDSLAEDGRVDQAVRLAETDCVKLSCSQDGFTTVEPNPKPGCGPDFVPKPRLLRLANYGKNKAEEHRMRNARLAEQKDEVKKKFIADRSLKINDELAGDPIARQAAIDKLDREFEAYWKGVERPTNIDVVTGHIPQRVGISATTGDRITTQFAQAHFIVDNDSGKIIAFELAQKRYPTDPPGTITTIWNPAAGYRDGVTGETMGSSLPGETTAQKQAAFDALLNEYLKPFNACQIAKDHRRANEIESDPSLSVSEAFFAKNACDDDGLPCCQTEGGRLLCGKDQALKDSDFLKTMSSVTAAVENSNKPLAGDEASLKKRLNLRTIQAVRRGQLSSQAVILASMNGDPEFSGYDLGAYDSKKGRMVVEGSCEAEFNDAYGAEIARYKADVAALSKDKRQELADTYDKQILLDTLEMKFNECVYNVSGSANLACYPNCGQKQVGQFINEKLGDGTVEENVARIKTRNRVMGFVDESNIDDIFDELRDSLSGLDETTWDFSAFHFDPNYEEYNKAKGIVEKRPYFCNTPEGRSRFSALYERLSQMNPESPAWAVAMGAKSKVAKAVKAAKKNALDYLRDKQVTQSKECAKAAQGYTPKIEATWKPWKGFVKKGYDGVELWRDKNVMKQLIKDMATQSPPQLQEIAAYRKLMCQYQAAIDERDDTMFWIDTAATAVLLAIPVSEFLVAAKASSTANKLGLVGRALGAADTVYGTGRLYGTTLEAKEKIDNAKVLFSGNFATEQDVIRAEKAYADAVFMSAVMAGVVGTLGAKEMTKLGAQFRASAKAGRIVSESEAAAIAKAIRAHEGQVPDHLIRRVLKDGAPCTRSGTCAEALHEAIVQWAKGSDGSVAGLPKTLKGESLVAGEAIEVVSKSGAKIRGKISDFAPNGSRAPDGFIFVEDGNGVIHLVAADGAKVSKIAKSEIGRGASAPPKSAENLYEEATQIGDTTLRAPDGYVWHKEVGRGGPKLVPSGFSQAGDDAIRKIASMRDAVKAAASASKEVFYVTLKKDGKDVAGYVKIKSRGVASGKPALEVEFFDDIGRAAGTGQKRTISVDDITFFTAATNVPNVKIARLARATVARAQKAEEAEMRLAVATRQKELAQEIVTATENRVAELERRAAAPKAAQSLKRELDEARREAKLARRALSRAEHAAQKLAAKSDKLKAKSQLADIAGEGQVVVVTTDAAGSQNTGTIVNVTRRKGDLVAFEIELPNGRRMKVKANQANGLVRKPTTEEVTKDIEDVLGIKLSKEELEANPDAIQRLHRSAVFRKAINESNVDESTKAAFRAKHDKEVRKYYACLLRG